MSVYLRELNEDTIRLNQRLRVNNFIPEGILELVENNVPDNNYIIGVKYESGECQVCISGHPKEGETINEGCLRELCEELFLCPKEVEKSGFFRQEGCNHFYSFCLRETYINKLSIYKKGKDIPQRAVICVHGNEFEVLRYLSKIKSQDNNTDHINGIWAAKKNKIVSLIKRMQYNKRRSYIY